MSDVQYDNTGAVKPFPEPKWNGIKMRLTKAAREFTKRWKRGGSGFRVDGNVICAIDITVYFRGNGELVGWLNPLTRGFEPRSHDWVNELDLENCS